MHDRYRDQLLLSGHGVRPDDIERFAQLGISGLRYPLLWESFAHAHDPERLWAWHDVRLSRLRELGINPIAGLVHHGSGPATTDLLAANFATGLATHAAAVAQRYPWIRDWTPVNEPLTTARFSALYGHWYPHKRDEASFWLALLNQIDGICAAMREIRAVNGAARLIQTEDVGHTDATPECMQQAAFDNTRRWASWDLLTGNINETHPFWERLTDMGFARRLRARNKDPCPPDVLGINHYLTSDRYLDHRLWENPASSHGSSPLGPYADIETVRSSKTPPGLEGALRACWGRYHLPLAITELHNGCTREEQMRWLKEGWNCATQLRAEGMEIEAITFWSLLGAYDWDSLLTNETGNYESGVFDVRGPAPRATALAQMIRTLAAGQTPDHPVLSAMGWWRQDESCSPPPSPGRSFPVVRPLIIAGATGTLGQAFAGACRLRGIEHVLTNRDMMELRDQASIDRTLDAVRPWAVINCTGWVDVDAAEGNAEACLAANFQGSINLSDACRHRDIHYTCFSSDLVFDGLLGRAYVESDTPAPLSIYGLSKSRADALLQAQGGRALLIRTASFFSPYDRHNFAAQLVAALRAERRFGAVDDCITSPTYVPDLVRATLDLVIDDEVGLWHLVNDGALSWAEFAFELGATLNLRTELIDTRPSAAMGWVAARPRHASLTSERGLIVPSLASAIRRFAEAVG